MILDLYVAAIRGYRISVSSLTIASLVPPTTALRHIKAMEEKGEIIRDPDPTDGRRHHLRLSPQMMDSVTGWINSVLTASDRKKTISESDETTVVEAPTVRHSHEAFDATGGI